MARTLGDLLLKVGGKSEELAKLALSKAYPEEHSFRFSVEYLEGNNT
jgi:hypothetical protein